MSTSPITPEKPGISKNMIEFLYPHGKNCLRIVVPRIKKKQMFLVKLIHNYNCQTICIVFCIFVLFKIVFGRSRLQTWLPDILSTLAIFLAQGKPIKSHRLWVSIWNGELVLFSLFSTAALSAICYKTIISTKYISQIDSLDDLVQSNLTILVPSFLSESIKFWENNVE